MGTLDKQGVVTMQELFPWFTSCMWSNSSTFTTLRASPMSLDVNISGFATRAVSTGCGGSISSFTK